MCHHRLVTVGPLRSQGTNKISMMLFWDLARVKVKKVEEETEARGGDRRPRGELLGGRQSS